MAVRLNREKNWYERGGYARFHTTQENHTEIGLQQYWINNDKAVTQDDSKATQGSILHQYFCGHLRGEAVKVDEEWAKKPVERFQEFAKDLTPMFTELPVVSTKLGIGCTIDFIGEYQGQICLMDWKTGELYDSGGYQLAINQEVYRHYTGDLIDAAYLVQIHRDGEKAVKVKPVNDLERKLRGALCTFERWKLDNEDKLRWANAPDEILQKRKGLRGNKRKAFEKKVYFDWYCWPWLHVDSLKGDSDVEKSGFPGNG